jgi:hypothetical protein
VTPVDERCGAGYSAHGKHGAPSCYPKAGDFYATDIADEPCFAHVVNRPEFQAIRSPILALIEEARR